MGIKIVNIHLSVLTSFLANTCVNWPFSRTHLPVVLDQFLLSPIFGIHMEVLDADLEQIKKQIYLILLPRRRQAAANIALSCCRHRRSLRTSEIDSKVILMGHEIVKLL